MIEAITFISQACVILLKQFCAVCVCVCVGVIEPLSDPGGLCEHRQQGARDSDG